MCFPGLNTGAQQCTMIFTRKRTTRNTLRDAPKSVRRRRQCTCWWTAAAHCSYPLLCTRPQRSGLTSGFDLSFHPTQRSREAHKDLRANAPRQPYAVVFRCFTGTSRPSSHVCAALGSARVVCVNSRLPRAGMFRRAARQVFVHESRPGKFHLIITDFLLLTRAPSPAVC